MRQRKTILRKIEAIKNSAIMAPAVYRLFTYVPWADIPENHKDFFPKEAADVWDEDLKEFKENNIILDLDTEVKAVLKALNKRLIIQALALMPIVLADFFILGNPMDPYQLSLKNITDNYIENLTLIGQAEAELYAMIQITDLLKKIVNKVDLDISKNFTQVTSDMLNFYIEDNEKQKEYSKVMEVLGNGKADE